MFDDKRSCKNIRKHYMQILFIDPHIPERKVFVDSVNNQTRAIVCSTMPPFLPARIERVGFIFILDTQTHSTSQWFGPDHEKQIVQLIRDRGIKQIDFLACNTLQYLNWFAYYKRLTQQTGVIIGASNDQTGNLKYGGNWTMESTGQNIELVYFTRSIEYYKYLLDDAITSDARNNASTCRAISNDIAVTRNIMSSTLNSMENLFTQATTISVDFQTNYATQVTQATQNARLADQRADLWNNTALDQLATYVSTLAFQSENDQANLLQGLYEITDNVSTARSYIPQANSYSINASQKAKDAEDAATVLETGVTGDVQDQKIEVVSSSLTIIGYDQTQISQLNTSISLLNTNVINLLANVSSQKQNILNTLTNTSTAYTAFTTFADTLTSNSNLNDDIDCIIPIVDSNGNLYTVGNNVYGQAGMGTNNVQLNLTFNTSQVSLAGATRYGMIYLTNGDANENMNGTGQVYFSGKNQYGELGSIPLSTSTNTSTLNADLANIIQFSAGLYHVLFLDSTNNVISMGLNHYGQLGTGDTVNSSSQNVVTECPGIQVAVGKSHSVILSPDLTVYTFGKNKYGQLGIGNNEPMNRPFQAQITDVTQVACGANHTLFLSQETVYACGKNDSCQLGIDPIQLLQTSTPTIVPGLIQIVSISAGGDTSAALDIVGNLWVWGSNGFPSIVATQVTYVQVTFMGIFYVTNQQYYVMNSKSILQNGPLTFGSPGEPIFLIQSNICFPADTPVSTDQGDVFIQDLVPRQHTIRGKPVVALTETYSTESELVVFEKDALFQNYPCKQTVITREHKIFYQGGWNEAYQFLKMENQDNSLIYSIPYNGEPLYNVLLEEPGRMKVNNMIVETLDPKNMIGKIFKKYHEERNKS